MTMKLFYRIFCLLLGFYFVIPSLACTNFIVGKNASADGSVLVTYNDDSYGKFGYLCHYPAGKHKAGEMRRIINWENGSFLGEIKEAKETYNVVGNINEYQVCICETTFGGRRELQNTNGIIDYGSLIYLALQRSKTARQAIDVMTSLVEEYGYYSTGESFSVCDKNEGWILEMIGKGPDVKGALWVAIRIPDDCISAHANQSRITTFPLKDHANCIYSKDLISFARSHGFFDGKDEDFSFRNAYDPEHVNRRRTCDARVWSFFRHYNKSMDDYLPYLEGDRSIEQLPLYIKPDHKVTLREIKNDMRDHYEGTALDLRMDVGAGGWQMPYRPSPLSFEDNEGRTYFNERPISTQQTAFTLVGQLRNWLPDEIGGVFWFNCDDANMVAYVPVYCCTTTIPTAFAKETSNAATYNPQSAFWLSNAVSNFVYPRYSALIEDLRTAQCELEDYYESEQPSVEKNALAMNYTERKKYLDSKTNMYTEKMMDRWSTLFGYLIVKHNDMVVRDEVDGKFVEISDEKCKVTRTGYPQQSNDLIGKSTGERYLKK